MYRYKPPYLPEIKTYKKQFSRGINHIFWMLSTMEFQKLVGYSQTILTSKEEGKYLVTFML